MKTKQNDDYTNAAISIEGSLYWPDNWTPENDDKYQQWVKDGRNPKTIDKYLDEQRAFYQGLPDTERKRFGVYLPDEPMTPLTDQEIMQRREEIFKTKLKKFQQLPKGCSDKYIRTALQHERSAYWPRDWYDKHDAMFAQWKRDGCNDDSVDEYIQRQKQYHKTLPLHEIMKRNIYVPKWQHKITRLRRSMRKKSRMSRKLKRTL